MWAGGAMSLVVVRQGIALFLLFLLLFLSPSIPLNLSISHRRLALT
jgi:hypothetical protein